MALRWCICLTASVFVCTDSFARGNRRRPGCQEPAAGRAGRHRLAFQSSRSCCPGQSHHQVSLLFYSIPLAAGQELINHMWDLTTKRWDLRPYLSIVGEADQALLAELCLSYAYCAAEQALSAVVLTSALSIPFHALLALHQTFRCPQLASSLEGAVTRPLLLAPPATSQVLLSHASGPSLMQACHSKTCMQG